jgi:hypothetical protein
VLRTHQQPQNHFSDRFLSNVPGEEVMERSRKLLLMGGIVLIFALLFSACVPAASTPPPSEISGGNTQPAAAATSSGGESGTGGEAPAAPSGGETGSGSSQQIPEDIPVPDGAYDQNINTSVGQMDFKVAGDAASTLAFYQDNLPQDGWELLGAEDTAVGNTALMLRTNAHGDRLSINLQYNPNGSFTVVTLYLNRAP